MCVLTTHTQARSEPSLPAPGTGPCLLSSAPTGNNTWKWSLLGNHHQQLDTVTRNLSAARGGAHDASSIFRCRGPETLRNSRVRKQKRHSCSIDLPDSSFQMCLLSPAGLRGSLELTAANIINLKLSFQQDMRVKCVNEQVASSFLPFML